MKRAYIVARCSTNEDRQDVSRQSSQLFEKHKSQYDIVGTKEYYASGLSNQEENEKIITDAIQLNTDVIIVSEISRIARRIKGVIDFTETCKENKISILIDDKNLHTLNEDGSENDVTKMILSIGSIFAEMELKTTLSRLQSGYSHFRERGGKVGRPVDSKLSSQDFLAKHADIVRHLKKKQSIRNTAKITEKSISTVTRVKKVMEI